MASTQQLKSRIRSVKSTKQITKAMQMVAASKMRRAQDSTKRSAPYARAANELLSYLASQGVTDGHKWFDVRPIRNRMIILVASDKGLAGAYNANVFKAYLALLREDKKHGITNKTLSVGRKASAFVSRLSDVEMAGAYEDMTDFPDSTQFHALLATIRDAFISKEVDAVDVVYTRFITSITQTAETERLFPAGYETVEVSDFVKDAKFEPNAQRVLDDAAYRLVGSQLFQALLDARASEHSMRMLAMKNATDNASDLVDDLTLVMNKARQGAITQELSEMSAGVEALK